MEISDYIRTLAVSDCDVLENLLTPRAIPASFEGSTGQSDFFPIPVSF